MVPAPQLGSGPRVRRGHPTPDQILAKLRDADVWLAQGDSIADVARKFEVSEQTYHRWRNQFGGMKGEEMKRLKQLEQENARLKRVVADQAHDIRVLKDISEGNF